MEQIKETVLYLIGLYNKRVSRGKHTDYNLQLFDITEDESEYFIYVGCLADVIYPKHFIRLYSRLTGRGFECTIMSNTSKDIPTEIILFITKFK